jgi:hypothetical protein
MVLADLNHETISEERHKTRINPSVTHGYRFLNLLLRIEKHLVHPFMLLSSSIAMFATFASPFSVRFMAHAYSLTMRPKYRALPSTLFLLT